MKQPIKAVTLIILLVLFAACTKEEPVSDIPVIHFEGAEERTFDITEILEDPTLVRLETNESALINRAQFAIGEKYIIAENGGAILQFTREGAFIRILVHKGRGPREFLGVRAWAMDEEEEKLYIDHSGSKINILVFDLNSGNFDRIVKKPLESVGAENGFSIDQMVIVNDSMYCVPQRNSQTGLYIQRTSGEFLAGFPRDDQIITAGAYLTGKPFLAIESETNHIRYKSRDTDTLFSISGTAKEPHVALTYEEKFTYKPKFTEITGNLMNLLGEGPSGILFEKLIGTAKANTASIAAGGLYFTDKTGFTPAKISRLMMGQLEFPVERNWEQSNDKVFLALSAVDLKDMLRSAIENSSGNPEALERWKSLDAQISEYDNPILLIGKMK